MPRMLPRSFFRQLPLVCARELIGAKLIWGKCAGTIVETEAYSTEGDEACHTFLRPSARAFVEAHPAGTAYVYLNYGVHWLFNVVIKGDGEEGFVLLRALEPTEGIAAMERRRGRKELRALCSGPGKLTQALGIGGREHGRDLCAGEGAGFGPRSGTPEIETDVRIGISKAGHLPWRFLRKGSLFVSRGKRKPARRTGLASGE